jgi:hypothetical protein
LLCFPIFRINGKNGVEERRVTVPFCPTCRTEYQSGIRRCADCDAELVDALPEEEEKEQVSETGLVLLAVFPNAAEARLIQELLRNNGIEAVLRGDMDPIGNVTGKGPALLVEETALPQATEIYETFFAGAGSESDELPPEHVSGETNSQ